jgi:hypothetical protein
MSPLLKRLLDERRRARTLDGLIRPLFAEPNPELEQDSPQIGIYEPTVRLPDSVELQGVPLEDAVSFFYASPGLVRRLGCLEHLD